MTGLSVEPTGLQVVEETPPKRYDGRWRLNRGGIVNVWYYYDAQFAFSGGRIIWRGANGSGKSRALELLFPYLLDGNRRAIDATGASKVRLEDLMRAGAGDSLNRIGYLWVELVGVGDDGELEYLTIGAHVRYSRSSGEARVLYFTTPLRVGEQLRLMDEERLPLGRERLAELIGHDRLSETAEGHRERVRSQVFGLAGEAGRERYAGLLQLLHVLRNPDVGNRIDSGALPSILSDALPPLSEAALNSAGDELDGLSEIRAGQQRLQEASGHVQGFLTSYRRYAVGVLSGRCEQTGEASAAARLAATKAKRAHADAEQSQNDHQQAHAELTRLSDEQRQLTAQINGVKQSEQYRAAEDLDAREGQVRGLARAAESALDAAGRARRGEQDAVRDADERAREVLEALQRAAATQAAVASAIADTGLTETVGQPCGGTATAAGLVREPVRTGLRQQAEVNRPAPAALTLSPADPSQTAGQALHTRQAAVTRASLVVARRQEALALAEQKRKVDGAEQRADVDELRADDDARTAETAAIERDEAALALARAWRSWIAEPVTPAAFGEVDWSATAAGPLLADLEALAGPDDARAEDQLQALDGVAAEAAGPARNRLAAERARIDLERQQLRAGREQLSAEREELRAARDPLPATPPWQVPGPDGGVPLWRLIDFRDEVAEGDRPGIEGALQAAGFLTAAVHPDGSLTAADGQVLLRADAAPAEVSLTRVLRPDPASPLPASLVSGLLGCVGYGARSHAAWVAGDGRWGNGPLEGALRPRVARHIGAQARAAAREVRLKQIEVELAEVERQDDARLLELARLDERDQALTQQVRRAPRTASLAQARARSRAADAQARKAEQLARQSRERAAALRTAWHDASQVHEQACSALGVPSTVDALAAALRLLEQVSRDCAELAERMNGVATLLGRHAQALAKAQEEARLRIAAERNAEHGWQVWKAADTEFAALRETIGADAEQVRARLRQAEEALDRTSLSLEEVRLREGELRAASARASEQALHAHETAENLRGALAEAVADLRAVLALPGLRETAFTSGAEGSPLPEANPATIVPAHVDMALDQLTAELDARGGPLDETGLAGRQQALERAIVGTYDVSLKITYGVWLIELVDATGARTVVEAAAELARKVAEGKSALSSREYRVFADFVLGGIAEELRSRLTQAEALIKAMNSSVANVRTSQGIGVKINWTLDVEPESPLARLRTLVATANQVRTAAQSDELIELIKGQVEERFAADATAGYAAHLKAALDYRDWHQVDVIITGPEPGQQRRISRRAKLSQGETRFVSYVTLFAAADAYLSGLPDTSRALRLVLLDDAFAKVDERTIGELMGLLVRWDMDFAMTGHALWGCFPEVPALDIYEVRRRDGSAAVTTHVHWDGKARHLRSA